MGLLGTLDTCNNVNRIVCSHPPNPFVILTITDPHFPLYHDSGQKLPDSDAEYTSAGSALQDNVTDKKSVDAVGPRLSPARALSQILSSGWSESDIHLRSSEGAVAHLAQDGRRHMRVLDHHVQ